MPARLAWPLIAALSLLDWAALRNSAITLAPGLLTPVILAVAGLLALSYFYATRRPEPRISALAHMGAITIAFTVAIMMASYAAASLARPLIDPALVAADRAIGFDWPAVRAWVVAHHAVHLILAAAYGSIVAQPVVLLVVLNFMGRTARAWEMLWLYMTACLACIACSALWPAAGAFGYFHVAENTPYVRVFMALRGGGPFVIHPGEMQGIVQFPSLHTALALLYAYAARGVRFLFPLFIAINALMLCATAPVGGHHLADIWGGAVLALGSVLAVKLCSVQEDNKC